MRAPLHRRPESVLVVIYTRSLECLLLERIQPPGFWQSVTGSLRWDETPLAAARREVMEETGLSVDKGLSDARISHTFTILPHYRDQYGPDVTQNTEHLWYLEVARSGPVRLDPTEHNACCWLPVADAIERVSSWTNREALVRLRE